MEEIYISTDVETDGPIPGPHSMLSFGSAAFNKNGDMTGTFAANLVELPGALPDPDTATWWKTQPEAWAACRENVEPALPVMRRYSGWLEAMKDKGRNPVFVGYPASFDFMFIYWYLVKFTEGSPFGFQALDIKTYAAAVLGCDFKMVTKKNMPKRWFQGLPPHNHKALDDAIEQGMLFMNIRKERTSG